MSWRLAKSLETLRKQINEAAPGRSKASDGTVGDAAHATRASDHNPWVKDGAVGVVTALDITHDPLNGVDCAAIAEALRASRDPRLKYIIWNRRIWTPTQSPNWRAYKGVNPHDRHVHVSVISTKARYDNEGPWAWGAAKTNTAADVVEDLPLLHEGITGQDAHIALAKAALQIALKAEKGFGPLLDGLARGFQKQHGLKVDGKIGSYTWPLLRL
jgi:peptidoglycan hydrolase-like protein with peptidoglycan-binding domain